MGSLALPQAPAAAGVADVDPVLAHLPEALEEAGRNGWTLHDVQWLPGRHCQLAWRVAGADGHRPTFQAGLVEAGRWSCHDYRLDAALPGLAEATDVSVVAPRLEHVVGQPLTSCRIEAVRYRAGSRCVLRYDVQGPGGGRTFYAKVFARRQFASTSAAVLRVVASAAPTGLVVPVAAVWSELDTVVTAAAAGRSASAVLADPAVAVVDRLETADRLGRLLADFHSLDADAAAGRSAADLLDELRQLGRCVATADPRTGERYDAALASLQATVPPEPRHQVLTHGGFRAGQVVLGPAGTLTLLDLDGVGLGDPAGDLATALAQLTWRGTRQPDQAEVLREVATALVAGYGRVASAPDPARLRWWRAGSILQLVGRRYRRLEVADWELVATLLDGVEDAVSSAGRRATSAPPAVRARPRSASTDELIDLHRMTRLLAPVLGPIAASDRVEVMSAQELAVARGRRRVVRYAIAGLDAAGPTDVVAKVFEEPRRAELLHRHLRVLSAGPFATGRWTVPQPLGYLPERALVLYRAGSGVPLSSLLDDAAAEQGVVEAARWLARLHRSGALLPRVLDTTREIGSALQWAATLAAHDAELHRPALRLASRWATVGPPGPAAVVPLHKDFHPGHVLVDEQVCVLDLDEARLGDPAYDVAHFCAYLKCGGHRAGDLRGAFVAEYARLTGGVDDVAFARFSAYTWLKIAKQLATRAGPWRDGGDGGWTPRAALAEGAAWLDR